MPLLRRSPSAAPARLAAGSALPAANAHTLTGRQFFPHLIAGPFHDGLVIVFWLAIATTAQGIARLVSGPVWGVISDRVGRKAMFLRALFLSSAVGATATALVTVVVVVTKFLDGAWMVLIAIPLLVLAFYGVRAHYRAVGRRLRAKGRAVLCSREVENNVVL